MRVNDKEDDVDEGEEEKEGSGDEGDGGKEKGQGKKGTTEDDDKVQEWKEAFQGEAKAEAAAK
eukprot:507051-Prorocentrum_lima.AAC.1